MMMILKLFIIFFQIGLFSIGGGYAMIPLIQKEIVGNGWLTNEEVTDVVAISQMTPGPFAVNAATFVGMKLEGVWGAIFATLGVTLPSVIIVLIIARYFFNFQKHPAVQGVLYGVRPVVTGLIASAGFVIAETALLRVPLTMKILSGITTFFQSFDYWGIAIAVVVFLGVQKWKWHPILMIVVAGVLGTIVYSI